MKKLKKIWKKFFFVVAVMFSFFVISNLLIIFDGNKSICTRQQAKQFDGQCVLILGCGVWDGEPSPMLADRLDEGAKLYKDGAVKKIIVSGDHGQQEYDEVNVMKKYLMDKGIADEDIFMDHAGFSTYESIYRAKEIFGVEKMVIVTQKYHLYRALYIAKQLGVEAVGVNSDPRRYWGQLYRDFREWVARDKDIVYCLFKVKPTYLGEKIDINGSGTVTND